MKKSITMVLVAVATVSTVGAYTNKFGNSTTGLVEYEVRYVGESPASCRPDFFSVSPQHEHPVSSGLCSIKSVRATAYESLVGGEHVEGLKKERAVKATRYKSKLGSPYSAEYTVTGPIKGKYRVTQLVTERIF